MRTADPTWIRRAAWFPTTDPEPKPEPSWIDAWMRTCKRHKEPGPRAAARILYRELYEPDEYTGGWVKVNGILRPRAASGPTSHSTPQQRRTSLAAGRTR